MNSKKFKIAVFEDDPSFQEMLSGKIKTDCSFLKPDITSFSSTDAAPENSRPYDLALVDINFQEGNGIAMAGKLLKQKRSRQILFTSSTGSYNCDIYNVPHLGFFMPCEMESALSKFILGASLSPAKNAETFLLVKCGHRCIRLNTENILYFEHNGHSTHFALKNGRCLESRSTLDSLMENCTDELLYRCHKSCVVNFRHVLAWHPSGFDFEDGNSIPISRSHITEAKKKYHAYIGLQSDE